MNLQHEYRKALILESAAAPFFVDRWEKDANGNQVFKSAEDAGARFMKALEESKSNPAAEAEVMSVVQEALNFIPKAFAGLEDQLPSKAVEKANMWIKSVGNMQPGVVAMFPSYVNELQADLEWMQFFRTATEPNAPSAEVVDFTKLVTVEELGLGQDIVTTPFGKEAFTRINSERFGAGVPLLLQWVRTNRVYTANDVMTAIRFAFLEKKASYAYTKLFDTNGVSTQTSAGSTVDNNITAIEAAATTLIEANTNKGWTISAKTPLLYLTRWSHRGLINQVARRTMLAGVLDVTMLESLITPVYSTNSAVTAQLGAKNSGMLILPGLKNIWVTFQDNRTESKVDFSTDSIKIMAQEYWGATVNAAQKIIVNQTA